MALPLLPLSLIYSAVVSLSLAVSRWHPEFVPMPVPVVVIGTHCGGTGKTPITIWLAQELKIRGHNPA
jgi:tetraacyldisaccharide 4'-kinase